MSEKAPRKEERKRRLEYWRRIASLKVRASSGLKLLVGDLDQDDEGRGIARLSQKTMQELRISNGDAIEIAGTRTTSAIAWHSSGEDTNRGLIRVDRFTRTKAGVALNEHMTVRRARVKNAKSILLAPVDARVPADEDFTQFVKNRIVGRTFVEDDEILVKTLGPALSFAVISTVPRYTFPPEIVKVTVDTRITVTKEPTYGWTEDTTPISFSLTAADIYQLDVETQVSQMEYVDSTKLMRVHFEVKVKFKDLEQVWKCTSYMDQSQNISDFLEIYEEKVLNELEIVKDDIRKRLDRDDLPINMNLTSIGKIIVGKITHHTLASAQSS